LIVVQGAERSAGSVVVRARLTAVIAVAGSHEKESIRTFDDVAQTSVFAGE
jgi:hypothetical protein